MALIYRYPDGTEGPAQNWISADGQTSYPMKTLDIHADNPDALAALGVTILGPAPAPPAPATPTEAETNAIFRLECYRAESDPLFFKWQRGEGTKEEWLVKVAEIQKRYPKV